MEDPSSAVDRSWTPPEDPGQTRQVLIDLLSVLSRVIPATYFTIVCFGFWNSFTQTGKWTSLLWIVSEGLVILLLVFRRESRRLSRSPWDWIVALGGSFTVLLVRPRRRRSPWSPLALPFRSREPCARFTARSLSGEVLGSSPPTGGSFRGDHIASSATRSTSGISPPTSDSCWPTGVPGTSPSISSSIFSRFRGSCRRSDY